MLIQNSYRISFLELGEIWMFNQLIIENLQHWKKRMLQEVSVEAHLGMSVLFLAFLIVSFNASLMLKAPWGTRDVSLERLTPTTGPFFAYALMAMAPIICVLLATLMTIFIPGVSDGPEKRR